MKTNELIHYVVYCLYKIKAMVALCVHVTCACTWAKFRWAWSGCHLEQCLHL